MQEEEEGVNGERRVPQLANDISNPSLLPQNRQTEQAGLSIAENKFGDLYPTQKRLGFLMLSNGLQE